MHRSFNFFAPPSLSFRPAFCLIAHGNSASFSLFLPRILSSASRVFA